ncbi:hypothetical protein BS47DRAFT_1148853 [Hydnum rufescens UP504]|uniref:Uncharacterized protein n=1 Tax=Hydnum rufescens UP504 TaxID=1448309 RepID=A0A9P6DYG1_9AGAM|nr:hypothetical protein BS47DRAFT_1148853 [Hydnum rufescens UP504]
MYVKPQDFLNILGRTGKALGANPRAALRPWDDETCFHVRKKRKENHRRMTHFTLALLDAKAVVHCSVPIRSVGHRRRLINPQSNLPHFD